MHDRNLLEKSGSMSLNSCSC